MGSFAVDLSISRKVDSHLTLWFLPLYHYRIAGSRRERDDRPDEILGYFSGDGSRSAMATESPKILTTSQTSVPSWANVPAPAVTPEPGRKSPWDRVIEQLNTMMSLGDDWDGMGAEAPSRAVILSGIDLVGVFRSRGYPAPTRVAATPSGTVGLEWQVPPVYLEVEIITPDRSEWMQIVEDRPPVHGTLSGRPLVDSLEEGMPPVFGVARGSRIVRSKATNDRVAESGK